MVKSEELLSSLRIHLLGPFRLLVDGRPIDPHQWSRRKPVQLVKLLALQPHHQLHREQAMEFLWPDLDGDAAANNLNKCIYAARRALEPQLEAGGRSSFLVTRGGQVQLRAPGELWIDTELFAQMALKALKTNTLSSYESALALYGGELLIEDPYPDWTRLPRENFRAMRQELIAKSASLYASAGKYEQAIERWKEAVRIDPADERAHRELMRLYSLTGNRPQALHQYQQCEDFLRQELDTTPDPATQKLRESILSGAAQGNTPTVSSQKFIDSIAVLPFVNVLAKPDAEYLSDGISEGIIQQLSQFPKLRVMAWSSVSRYKGSEIGPQAVGEELRVASVLTGRVLQHREYLLVKAELVDVADGSCIWGEQYKLDPAEAFTVESKISRDISESLRLKLSIDQSRRLVRRQTGSTDAYHAYLKGRYYWNKRTVEWLQKGVEHFRQAIDLDPGYASAYAGLSDSYTLLVVREAIPPGEGFAGAKAAASMALRLDDKFAEAHASLGHALLHNWEWQDAEKELRRSVELNAGYASAHHWYSEYLTAMGRCAASLVELKLAGELDPLSLIISADLGRALYYARQYDEVAKQEARTLEMDPHFWLSHINLGRSFVQQGLHSEAIAALQNARTLSAGNTEVLAFLGFAFAAAGQESRARQALSELTSQAQKSYVPPYHLAIVCAGLNDSDRALEWLERAFERHAVDLFTLKVEPMLDNLRSHPRFQDLLRRIGLFE